ncbi:MAG: phage integrase N-terminal SAM-like domain-containing protein [Bacteroidetes bacterium]|nr:phage integrase N-terminal SAM-like domain-containing protein [Bacteroidota bacterium]
MISIFEEQVYSAIMNEYHLKALKATKEKLRLLNYSDNTIRNYINWLQYFFERFPEQRPSQISKKKSWSFFRLPGEGKNGAARRKTKLSMLLNSFLNKW